MIVRYWTKIKNVKKNLRINSVMPEFESYGSDRSRRGPLLDLYNSPRYPYYNYTLPDNYYQENNHGNALPPTRPRSLVEQMRGKCLRS
ncbi:hypothetical protein TNIN_6841 [Trichonephila inaurata madagascariensis]|uniref:Uncharacterized protein n=1 Tax=Trichonephila inaurata madagascariensis TaxID=2747483 RepID=A0A8X6WLV6_9ARAC|nr:hypothetical protein TNIN_6841 [Trichonephila inaurata madagascariensis]